MDQRAPALAFDEGVVSHPGRWHVMTGCALGLAEAQRRDRAIEDCLACLESVLEVFPREVDPVDDEPGYAVRSLAIAMRKRLTELSGAGR